MNSQIAGGQLAARPALIAVGTNLGDRVGYLRHAWAGLARLARLAGLSGTGAIRASMVYESAPVGGPPQRPYLNGAVRLDWTGTALDLFRECQRIEAAADRTRMVRWQARTLDLDLIAVGTERIRSAELDLPHPRALQRAFVVRPLLDLGATGVPFDTETLLTALGVVTKAQPIRLWGPWPRPHQSA